MNSNHVLPKTSKTLTSSITDDDNVLNNNRTKLKKGTDTKITPPTDVNSILIKQSDHNGLWRMMSVTLMYSLIICYAHVYNKVILTYLPITNSDRRSSFTTFIFRSMFGHIRNHWCQWHSCLDKLMANWHRYHATDINELRRKRRFE